MAVIRVEKSNNYSVISNIHLRDKNISLKAKGLMSVMLSLPDEWKYSINGLTQIVKESEETIRTVLKELKDNGYVTVAKSNNEQGKFDYEYTIYEEPNMLYDTSGEKPGMVKPGMVKPGMVKPGMVKPGMVEPGMVKPGMVKPGMVKPGMVEPGMVEPDMVFPTQLNTNILNTNILSTNILNTNKINTYASSPPPEAHPVDITPASYTQISATVVSSHNNVVLLSMEQFDSLVADYGLLLTCVYIDRLADFINSFTTSHGYPPTVRSHFRKIKKWIGEDSETGTDAFNN